MLKSLMKILKSAVGEVIVRNRIAKVKLCPHRPAERGPSPKYAISLHHTYFDLTCVFGEVSRGAGQWGLGVGVDFRNPISYNDFTHRDLQQLHRGVQHQTLLF